MNKAKTRKTNLFYVNTQDSNFLTFSNFTEALTGNFLSTDWKVYPSRFLCLYIPELLDENNKLDKKKQEDFIKNYLVSYYENKLAYLRDVYTKILNDGVQTLSDNLNEEIDAEKGIKELETFDIEGDINAFAWLIHTINNFDPNNEVTFIGEVTEFDYKGTYTDTICIIDSSEGYSESTGNVKTYKINVTSDKELLYDESENVLYGWKSSELESSPYSTNDITLKFDDKEDDKNTIVDFGDNNKYYIYSNWNLEESEDDNRDFIKFNVIIPLFDITNIYYTNFNQTEEGFTLEENLELKNYIKDPSTGEIIKQDIDYSDREKRSINNPLGIWFADELIELRRDKESKYSPSWSLTISSQFKPFPYSNKYHKNDIKDDTRYDLNQSFYTFAKILGEQNKVTNNLSKISTRLSVIEQTLSKLETLDNKELIEKISSLELLTNNLQETLDNLDSVIDTKIATAIEQLKYKWK